MDAVASVPVEGLAERVGALRWFHRILLPGGIVTPGVDDSSWKLAQLPREMAGWSVLDVGAWDGLFAFECERRGASRVVALDSYAWDGGGWGTRACFDLAREALGSKVESVRCDVLDISPDELGTFDLVLFLGVLYHMRHPLLALERVASVCRHRLLLSTAIDLVSIERPSMVLYPRGALNGDPSNWWGPNVPCVVSMLEDVGFQSVKLAAVTAPLQVEPILQHAAIFHAWK